MANLFSRLFNLFSPDLEAPIYVPAPPVLPTTNISPNDTLAPLKSWSHPFKDKADPLLQLTQMARATAGYYPLGRNGLWHGGVHFDSGTAGTLDQSSVHCLADGEVVAYRIDEHSPTTAYFVNELPVQYPFSRNFVLVRHRLQAPNIEGSTDAPPSLTFYSFYMHLQDWAVYRNDPSISRPDYWPEGQTRRVKSTSRDVIPGYPEQVGLNVRNQAQGGKVLAILLRDAEVTVSGDGEYRKLENTNGPEVLKNADGSLRGYLYADHLVPIGGDEYQVKASPTLAVRSESNTLSEILMKLPNGTEVVVSGEGEFRKLERVNQYVHFSSLEGALEPITDRIQVLDQPIAIKAGDLIGHIGEYHDPHKEYPEQKLHMEVFSADRMEHFTEASRAWAQRLPDTGKTLLKLAKGTAVVAHQAHFSTARPPTLSAASTPSDADLLVPRSLLDSLSAENKLVIAATAERKTCNWYRLTGLLNDANGALLDGWVCEEVGVTPWVNPWSWEGFDVIFNLDSPRQALASFIRATKRFSEEELKRYGGLADKVDKGRMKGRLYDIIDRDRNGEITAEELQAAISLPAHAQSLSQLIIFYESEWRHERHKWDALDEVLGHSGSTPLLNWLAEKDRIKEISWWNEVAGKVGLPVDGQVYHMHPVGFLVAFYQQPACMSLHDAIELALRVSGGYEGRSSLDFHALADDFDGQGTSFGLIQWNFGQGTLDPILLKMMQSDHEAFANCFPDNTDYKKIKSALIAGDREAQLTWVRELIRKNKSGWRQAFNALGHVLSFQTIQLEAAASYHNNVIGCVSLMRRVCPLLMEHVGVLTYVALYDLCVQQGGLAKGDTEINIRKKVTDELPRTQKEFLKICVQERAKTASSRWKADAMSRRMGIIEQKPYSADIDGWVAARENKNIGLLLEKEIKHVCDI